MDLKQFEGATPGPWEQDDPNSTLIAARYPDGPHKGCYNYICECDAESYISEMSGEEIEANARLIAAAPELLARVTALEAENAALKAERDLWRQEHSELLDGIHDPLKERDQLRTENAVLRDMLQRIRDNAEQCPECLRLGAECNPSCELDVLLEGK
ncbi:MAG: hypothetical protein C4542_02955 [Dehalococcoidia bacterium]|nr:MAG: hypothetical protein C4542_02955 [Dehalococcoidia bacterium]